MSSTNIALVVVLDGNEIPVTVKAGDVIRWERHFAIPIEKLDRTIMEHGVYLAFLALKRQNDFDGDFDDFLDRLDGLEGGDEVPVPSP